DDERTLGGATIDAGGTAARHDGGLGPCREIARRAHVVDALVGGVVDAVLGLRNEEHRIARAHSRAFAEHARYSVRLNNAPERLPVYRRRMADVLPVAVDHVPLVADTHDVRRL